ncbi:MAG: Tad domain-containing protein, partial [Phycisphaerae bacterium]|nr:Tad domain-containing protein [Phycisphaerae bacterium]
MKRTACKNVVRREFTPAPAPHLRGRSGQVMVVVLLAMTLLVGLVFFVYNLGDQVNRRLATQNAADAVAVSGAGWMARSMNVIAMNNVATARLLGIAPVLDSLPLAVELTLAELPQLEASLERLAARIEAGAPPELSKKERAILAGAIACLIRPYGTPPGTTTKKSDILEAIDEALGAPGFSMEDITHWRIGGRPGPPPHGKIWEGVVALGEFSRATGICAGVLAQHNAVRFGRENGAKDACVLPYEPLIPAVQGEFEDFKPVLLDRIAVSEQDGASYTEELANWQLYSRRVGGAIPDWSDPHRVGPWGKLFRWWDRLRQWIPTGLVGSGNVPMGGWVSGNNAMSAGYWKNVVPPVHHTYGPYSRALRLMRAYGELRGTHFYEYLDQLADIKMNYMFNPPDDLETVLCPEWITDYNTALGIASSDPARIRRTRYYRVRIISSVARGSQDWLGRKTYTDPRTGQQVTVDTFRTNQTDPEVFVPRDWYDPNTFAARKLTGLAIWEDEWVGKHTGAFP